MMIGITPAGIAAWTTSTRLSSTGQGSQRATHRMSTGRIPSRTAHAATATFRDKNQCVKVDLLGKLGFGPTFPHVQNTLFDLSNKGHFHVGGFNEGAEIVLRATFFKYVYLEYCNKVDWADYYGLRLASGPSHQAFGTYEEILNIGITFPMGPRVK